MMESTFVSYPNGCIRKTRDLRIRPVPEMETCLVYTPKDPSLYTLNATAWVVLELCDGRSLRDLEEAFCRSVEPLMSAQDPPTCLPPPFCGILTQPFLNSLPTAP